MYTFPSFRSVQCYACHACLCHHIHLYTLAHMSMHESCLLVCHPYFNTMKLWTFNPNLHLSPTDNTFCFLSYLFVFSLVCLLFCCYACHVYHAYLLYSSFTCSLHLFPFIARLLVSCLCLCMYTHGARTHGVRARSPRRKQKGQECKQWQCSVDLGF